MAIEQICEKEKCFGCSLCHDLRPVGAISIETLDGFYYPVIDKEKCVSCGKCQKLCPANNEEEIKKSKYETPDVAYAAWSKDDKRHFESASGGIATELSKAFLEQGGFVVGVWFNPETYVVEHKICETIDELETCAKSKYVQSSKTGIWKQIKEKIKEKPCLFIGVPCEVFAFKTLCLTLDQTKIKPFYCVDIICRGGASPYVFNEHIKQINKGKRIKNISFRGGKYDGSLVLYDNDNKIIYNFNAFYDPYYICFEEHSIFRKNCFSCKFAGSKRISDLTIGDFWGLDEQVLKTIQINGRNLFFINSDNGNVLINMIKDKVILTERPVEEAIKGNFTLNCPTEKPKEYDELWVKIEKDGFYEAFELIYHFSWQRKQRLLKLWNVVKCIFPPIVPIRRFIIKLLKGEG